MTQYKLSNVVRKETSTGKPMIKCTITPVPEGVIVDDVAIWSSFPDFANLKDGDVVMGELEVKQNGQYTNKTLNYPKPANSSPRGSYAAKGPAVEKAMERKEASIGKFQDNKELSIKISSTMRDAVLLAIAEFNADGGKNNTTHSLDELILKWRKWLVEHWSDADVPF